MSDLTVHIYNVYSQCIRLFSFNRKFQLRTLRHGPNKRIYRPKIDRAKGTVSCHQIRQVHRLRRKKQDVGNALGKKHQNQCYRNISHKV